MTKYKTVTMSDDELTQNANEALILKKRSQINEIEHRLILANRKLNEVEQDRDDLYEESIKLKHELEIMLRPINQLRCPKHKLEIILRPTRQLRCPKPLQDFPEYYANEINLINKSEESAWLRFPVNFGKMSIKRFIEAIYQALIELNLNPNHVNRFTSRQIILIYEHIQTNADFCQTHFCTAHNINASNFSTWRRSSTVYDEAYMLNRKEASGIKFRYLIKMLINKYIK
jgi:hypothetical protein